MEAKVKLKIHSLDEILISILIAMLIAGSSSSTTKMVFDVI